jgi:hypothetical protein
MLLGPNTFRSEENPSKTCFNVKKATISRCVSHADLPPSILWRNRQIEAHFVLRPKPRNRHGDFEAQITKPELPVLRPKLKNPPPPWFWGSTKKPTAGFEAKLPETVVTGFEPKPTKTVRVDLRPNHSQTIDLSFEAQPRNPRSSSPHARWRLHMAPPDHSIIRPLSTRHVRPSPVFCTRSPTPAMILVAARHATPTTCTPQDKQTWFSKQNKGKRRTKWNYPRFEFKHHQAKSMTHHNETKECTTWFLNLPLDKSIDNKSTKFKVRIQDPMKHS